MSFFVERASLFANLTGIFTIAGFVALGFFFAGTSVFGPINDAISVMQYLFMLPVVVVLYQKLQSQQAALAIVAVAVAALGIFAFATLQTLLLLRQVAFDQTLALVLTSAAVVGTGLLLFGLLMLQSSQFPTLLGWVSILNGASAIIGGIGFYRGNWQDPFAMVGLSLYAFSTIVWAFWLGRLLK